MMPRRAPFGWLPLSRALLLAGALAVSGCGSGSPPGGNSGAAPGATGSPPAGAGTTLTVATADDVKSLDPAVANDTWSTAVVHAFTRRLVDYDGTKLVPDLAEKWEITDGGKTYTFHVRAGNAFADGTAIEAKHFKTALSRVQDPNTASPGAGFFSGVGSVDAPDSRTLVVRLKAPDPTFLNVMGMTFAAPAKDDGDPSKPASSGAYMLESYEPGSQVILARNPHDEGGKAGVIAWSCSFA